MAALLFFGLVLVVAASTADARATCTVAKGKPWKLSTIWLDRVRRCRHKRFVCRSKLTRSVYAPFTRPYTKRQQRHLFLSEVNVPPKAETQNGVFVIAGQQTQKLIGRGLRHGGNNGLTGQYRRYGKLFGRKTSRVQYKLRPNPLVSQVLHTGFFPKKNTFVGLVFDARFNFEYSRRRRNRAVTAYYTYIVSKLGPRVGTIYLTGHSRGGCLAMRLAARLTRTYPRARVIVHSFDGVCVPKRGITRFTKAEFGVHKARITNPVRKEYYVYSTDFVRQFPVRRCLAVRSFIVGDRVWIKAARGFGHIGMRGKEGWLKTPAGFKWYFQSFHRQDHGSIDDSHHDKAIKHLQNAMAKLPCSCGKV